MRENADQELWDSLLAEYNHPFSGWDFSYLNGRRTIITSISTWNYTHTVLAAMQHALTLFDMHTGGGEALARLLDVQPVLTVYANELYPPNVIVARQQLMPLGVTVYSEQDGSLPFSDQALDLVINRHGSYDPVEVLRILKPDHLFITQQVGDQTNRRLHELLGHEKLMPHAWNVDYAAQEMVNAGWQIVERKEEFTITRFHDVGAIVYYLKAVPWEVPDFSVAKYWPKLVEIHRFLQRERYVDVPFHSFFLVARKP